MVFIKIFLVCWLFLTTCIARAESGMGEQFCTTVFAFPAEKANVASLDVRRVASSYAAILNGKSPVLRNDSFLQDFSKLYFLQVTPQDDYVGMQVTRASGLNSDYVLILALRANEETTVVSKFLNVLDKQMFPQSEGHMVVMLLGKRINGNEQVEEGALSNILKSSLDANLLKSKARVSFGKEFAFETNLKKTYVFATAHLRVLSGSNEAAWMAKILARISGELD